jgi:hypothetical protein
MTTTPIAGAVDVLVDAPIWSCTFRRRRERLSEQEQRQVDELSTPIRQRRARILGVVRQELLLGIRDAEAFDWLRLALRAFPDLALAVDISRKPRARATSAAPPGWRDRRWTS